MYRQVHGTIRQTRMQGLGNKPPDPHDHLAIRYFTCAYCGERHAISMKAGDYKNKPICFDCKQHIKGTLDNLMKSPSEPHDLISMHQKDTNAAFSAQNKHLKTLIEDARKDEIEAIKKYEYLIDEIMKYRDSIPSAVSVSSIFTAIRDQEKHHKALIERVQMNIIR